MGARKILPLERDVYLQKETLKVTKDSFPWKTRLKLAAELWRQKKTKERAEAICNQIDIFVAEIEAYENVQKKFYPRSAYSTDHHIPKYRIYAESE